MTLDSFSFQPTNLANILLQVDLSWASLIAQLVKNLPAMQETPGSILQSGRSAEEGIGYPFPYSWASLVAQLVKNPPSM